MLCVEVTDPRQPHPEFTRMSGIQTQVLTQPDSGVTRKMGTFRSEKCNPGRLGSLHPPEPVVSGQNETRVSVGTRVHVWVCTVLM